MRATQGEGEGTSILLAWVVVEAQSLEPALVRQRPGLQGGFLTWQLLDLGSDEWL